MKLVAVDDDDFAWFLSPEPPLRNGLRLAPDGLDDDSGTVVHVRTLTARMRADGFVGSWMMTAGGEVVGLCGFHAAPSRSGEVEIGYNVSPSRRRRGHATAAVTSLLEIVRSDQRITVIVANTDPGNIGSERALARNGFVRHDKPDAEDQVHWTRVMEATRP